MVVTGVMMFLGSRMTLARRVPFSLTAGYTLVLLHRVPTITLDAVVGMHIGAAIGPIPAPWRVADVHLVPIP